MSTIRFNGVDFHYADPWAGIFERLDLSIETGWRTGLVGRNGRGKTTLLRLIAGELEPARGEIAAPKRTARFPYEPSDPERTVRRGIRDAVAPFDAWEQRMEELLAVGDETSFAEYGEILERYEGADGYTIDAGIEREIVAVGLAPEILDRPLATLSGGERTRALIVPLFLRSGVFPLIDEPTNHLDMEGRALLASYLARKSGFILVSHDRAFLDGCIDHVVSIDRAGVAVTRGNYSEWKRRREVDEETERRRDANLRREIDDLEEAAQRRRSWSAAREKEKIGAPDKGFVGHRAAKQMKRALQIEERAEAKIAEKKELLRNVEWERELRLDVGKGAPEIVLTVEDLTLAIDGRTIVDNFSLVLRRGERVALVGPNGSGKTSLLRAIAGELRPVAGRTYLPRHLEVARTYQQPLWETGSLRGHLRDAGIDETRFRHIMGAFGVTGETFDRPLETFSQGERKKVDLCRSFMTPGHLLIWDEPMNWVDLMSREQIERVVLEAEPTMLFVEHDRRFVEAVATREVKLSSQQVKITEGER